MQRHAANGRFGESRHRASLAEVCCIFGVSIIGSIGLLQRRSDQHTRWVEHCDSQFVHTVRPNTAGPTDFVGGILELL